MAELSSALPKSNWAVALMSRQNFTVNDQPLKASHGSLFQIAFPTKKGPILSIYVDVCFVFRMA